MLTLTENFAEQLLQWESLARGGMLSVEGPVLPEPPFLPFEGYKPPKFESHDDGRRGLFGRRLSPHPSEIEAEEEEETPVPSIELYHGSPNHEIRLVFPESFRIDAGIMAAALRKLKDAFEPITFEILGTGDSIHLQFVVADADRDLVTESLEAYFPDAYLNTTEGSLWTAWNGANGESAVIDVGLAREVYFPLPPCPTDYLVGLVGALANLKPDECGVFQVVFQPTFHPWNEQIRRLFFDDGDSPLFEGSEPVAKLAQSRCREAFYAAQIRFAARAASDHRVYDILRGIGSSLSLFWNADSNGFLPLPNHDYPPALHEHDLLMRRSHRFGTLLTESELLGLVRLPSPDVRSPRFDRDARRTKPAPESVLDPSGVYLGINEHRGEEREVYLGVESRLRHTHLLGGSGTGKTNIILNLIREDMEKGHGIGLLEPAGDVIDRVLEVVPEHRLDDVVLVDPGDPDASVGFNYLAANSDNERRIIASDLVAVFQRLASTWGDRMNTLLRNAILAILTSPKGGTIAELRRFLVDDDYRAEYLDSVEDIEVAYYWAKIYQKSKSAGSLDAIVTRLQEFLDQEPVRHLVCQRNSLDLSSILNERKILLLKLSKGIIGEKNAFLLGSLFVSKIQQAALARQSIPEGDRAPWMFFIDEAHNFLVPSLAPIISEARKFGLGLLLAHQELNQIFAVPEVGHAFRTSSEIKLFMNVGAANAKAVADDFSFFAAEDIMALKRGQAIARVGPIDCDFNLQAPLAERPPEEVALWTRDEAEKRSRQKYGTPREEIDRERFAEMRRELGRPDPDVIIPPPPKNKRPTEEPADSSGEPAAAPDSAPKNATKKLPGRGGEVHSIYQKLAREAAKAARFMTRVEEEILGGKTILDVTAQRKGLRVACQVMSSTPTRKEFEAVRNCLEAEFDRIVLLGDSNRQLKSLRGSIRKQFSEEAAAKIDCISVTDLSRYFHSLNEPTEEEGATAVERTYTSVEEETRQRREQAFLEDLAAAMRGE